MLLVTGWTARKTHSSSGWLPTTSIKYATFPLCSAIRPHRSVAVVVAALILNARIFAAIDARFASLERRLERLETKVDALVEKINDLDKRLSAGSLGTGQQRRNYRNY